jgi:hypothetical protein
MQVGDFWQDVEAATNERQRSMFQCINRRLESLSREIEGTVGQVLDLRLEPVTITMDPPAAQDFHDSLQNLFAQGDPASLPLLLRCTVSAWCLASCCGVSGECVLKPCCLWCCST